MRSTPDAPAIRVVGLEKSYHPQKPKAVGSISFEVQTGMVLGLLGPNGAGKTTIIKIILGLVTPSAGTACLAGYDISRQRSQALRHAGAVLEGSRNIYWRLSARGNLEYFGGLRGMRGKELKQRIDAVLNLLELSDRANEETRQFSRGMQQKVALGVAMLHDPDVLLLDEPTLGLDVQAARTMKETIVKLVSEQGKTVLLTTHQMDLAEELCDQVFVINHGKKVAEGATREVIARFGEVGSTIEIRLGSNLEPAFLEALMSSRPWLQYSHEGDSSLLTLSDQIPQSIVVQLLTELDKYGAVILNVGRREANLEETFLRLISTGKGKG